MNNTKFDQMQDTVDALCVAMEKTPFQWKICVHTISFNGLKLWKDDLRKAGSAGVYSQIFSNKQGKKLDAAFKELQNTVADSEQQKAIKAVNGLSRGFGTKEPQTPPKPPAMSQSVTKRDGGPRGKVSQFFHDVWHWLD